MSSMDNDQAVLKRESSVDDDLAQEMSSARVSVLKDEGASDALGSATHNPKSEAGSPSSTSLIPQINGSVEGVRAKKEEDVKSGGQSSSKRNGGKASRAARSATQKIPPRVAPLFDDLPDATEEANRSYTVIDTCTYQNKYLGYTEHAMECDCTEEWDSATRTNYACGEDSDCINRATKMECVGDCACGSACQNQRFGRQMYASVSVIKTDKKGFGLRANINLKQGDFIFEYIGEVIAEGAFRRRMVQYDEEGIKHFYFMSLSKGEFVDATRKGNLGRFCNHSCNPNCYVDKWVVGDKLRMGIFAERTIRAGEELVFNYNVDRYGANPQPCYCGESNCTGFIGGKTQTERATKLSAATIEALGIDDDFDAWDTVVPKKPKKKKASEDDEEYVDSIEAKLLDPDGVTKVMAALMQCKEKWIAVRLLQRIERSNDEDVRHRIVKLHGYQIMNSQLSAWRDDENVILQILGILDTFPRLTRNKIVDARIDRTLEPLASHADERVAAKAQSLLAIWSSLELAYRIPRKARDAKQQKTEGIKFERRESAQQRRRSRSRSKSRSRSPPRGPSANIPAGPRAQHRPVAPPLFRRGPPPLPIGWNQATDEKTGRTYFYTAAGKTQWVRPTQPADQLPPPPPPPKQPSQQQVLKSIIDDIVAGKDKDRDSKPATPDTPEPSKRDKRPEKWRSYDEEKLKKLYENTLFPYISHVMSKYKHKIPKEDLKRFGKEIAKKLVNSDFKAGRVKDPTKIDEKQQKKVKIFCKEYFDKAAHKHKKHEADKAARRVKKEALHATANVSTDATPEESPAANNTTPMKDEASDDDEEMKMSDDEHEFASPTQAHAQTENNTTLKRKRLDIDTAEGLEGSEDSELIRSPIKKVNLESAETSPPPPPPPAPPTDTPPDAGTPNVEHESQDEPHSDLHADTSFRSKSMADVLAQAQQDDDDDGADSHMQNIKTEPGANSKTKFENGVEAVDTMMENPMVQGQTVVQRIKDENDARTYREEDEVEWA